MKITCRICKIQQGEFFTLDSEVPIYGQERKLLEIFNKCFQLNAVLQDPLPQVVCLACLDKLTEFYEFQLKAEKSDIELREVLRKENLIKIEQLEPLAETGKSLVDVNPLVDNKEEKQEFEAADDDNDFYDEEEVSYKGDEDNLPEDDEEDVEDTDILFELYSKNDSGLDNFMKFEYNNDSSQETAIIEYNNSQKNNTEIDQIGQILPTVTSTEENKDNQILNSQDKPVEAEKPTIEISRLKLHGQNIDERIVMLEPLVEVRKWQCPDCGRKYLTEEKLEQHQRLHKTSDACQCEICGKLKLIFFMNRTLK